MGMIRIEMWGSFPPATFETCAEEGGHVQAIKRSLAFLTARLSAAVQMDASLVKDGITPPRSALGTDAAGAGANKAP